MTDIFGAIAPDPAYVAAFSKALTSLWAKGVRATLDDYLERAALRAVAMKLKDKVAIVTGGARGIGAASSALCRRRRRAS